MHAATLAIALSTLGPPDAQVPPTETPTPTEVDGASTDPIVPPPADSPAPPQPGPETTAPSGSGGEDPLAPVEPPAVAAEPSDSQPETTPESADPVPDPVVDNDRPQARDSERAPSTADERADDEAEANDDFQLYREGGFISLSVGAGHCGTWCSHVPVLGGGRFEAGYRWGYIALGGSISLVGANYDTSASDDEDIYTTFDATGSTRFLHIGPTLQFFPATRGRFDPYASVAAGFRRVVETADFDGDGEGKYWESSFGVTLGAGIPVYVTDRISVGVRYDKSFAVRGKRCVTFDGDPLPDQDECESWSKLNEELNDVDSRYIRLSRPRPWTVALEMRIGF